MKLDNLSLNCNNRGCVCAIILQLFNGFFRCGFIASKALTKNTTLISIA